MDWNIALQLITLIVAVSSPICVTILTNRHHRKMEDIRFKRTTQLDLINQFSDSYSEFLLRSDGVSRLAFIRSAYKVLPFLTKKDQEMLLSLVEKVQLQKSAFETESEFTECLLLLFQAKL